MLADSNRAFALKLIDSLGLLQFLFPELEPFWNNAAFRSTTFRYFEQLQQQDYHLAFAILLREINSPVEQKKASRKPSAVKKFCKALKLSNQETDCIDWLVEHQTALTKASRLPLHQLKPLLSGKYALPLLELTRLHAAVTQNPCDDYDFCLQYMEKTPKEVLNPPPLLTGDDLIQLGMKPGKIFSELLTQVRHAQLDEQIQTQQEARELIGFNK